MDNVDKVRINFAAKTATVTLQPGTTLTKEECDAVFKDSPYGVLSLKEEPNDGSPS
jgi:hypothetical protein